MVSKRWGWNYSKRYFDRLLWLSYSGWAWEFKRRDPSIIGAHRRAGANTIILNKEDGSQLVRMRRRCRDAEAFGLHYLPDPRRSAYETPLFWLPDVMTTSLDAGADLATEMARAETDLRWEDIPGKKSILLVPGRREKLAVTARGYAAQLSIEGQSTPLPIAFYLTLRARPGAKMLENMRCIDRFARFCSGIKLEAATRRGYAPERLRQCLIALDGWRAGASQREIASVLFGKETADSDWGNGVHSYKSRTRRLIKKGRSLMDREYLNLL